MNSESGPKPSWPTGYSKTVCCDQRKAAIVASIASFVSQAFALVLGGRVITQ